MCWMFLISIYVGCLRNINVRLNYIDGVVNFKILNVLLDGKILTNFMPNVYDNTLFLM